MKKWILHESQLELIRQAGFGDYCEISFGNHDCALCGALGERWWPTTSSFHFSFGEMTITLEDVSRILGLSITGDPILNEGASNVEELLGRELPPGGGSTINLTWLYNNFGKLPNNPTIDQVIHF